MAKLTDACYPCRRADGSISMGCQPVNGTDKARTAANHFANPKFIRVFEERGRSQTRVPKMVLNPNYTA